MISQLTPRGMDAAVREISRYARLGHARVVVGWRRARLSLSRSPRQLCPDRAVADLPDDPHVLVLCLGNICRSPLAERYLRQRARAAGLDGLTVASAGFIETEDRPSPEMAVDVAGEYGIDLADHRSTLVTEAALAESDLVLLMDAENLADLERRFGRWARQAYFLTAFSADGSFEIEDPYGGDEAAFRDAYDEITQCLDAFVSRLEESR